MVESSPSAIIVASFLFDSGIGGKKEKVFQAYSSRKHVTTSKDPPASHHDVSSNTSPNLGTSISEPPLVNDFDLPIAVKKGVRSCVQHPMANYVFYQSLSPSYRCIAIGLSAIFVPHSVADALSQPQWKVAMQEEMAALEKNGTYELGSC